MVRPLRRGLVGLSRLQQLSSLNLSYNSAVRDIGLVNLTRLTNLRSLDLSYTGAPHHLMVPAPRHKAFQHHSKQSLC